MDDHLFELKATIIELLENVIKRIDDITGSRNGNIDLDEERLVNLIEDMQSLAEGMNIIKSRYADINLEEFGEKLELMERALSMHDSMLLADIMKFELRDLFEYWLKIIA
jgi:hypothetical protein